jgi:hypothetical protein
MLLETQDFAANQAAAVVFILEILSWLKRKIRTGLPALPRLRFTGLFSGIPALKKQVFSPDWIPDEKNTRQIYCPRILPEIFHFARAFHFHPDNGPVVRPHGPAA